MQARNFRYMFELNCELNLVLGNVIGLNLKMNELLSSAKYLI